MSAFMSAFASLVGSLADLLQPLFHTASTAAAIVLFTALVRLAVHPLSRAAARGQKARTRLQPKIAAVREKHARNPERMRKALAELHAAEKVSPLSGCLPSLLQAPAFFLLYHLFSSARIGGEPNALLGHRLFETPLGTRWYDLAGEGGAFGAQGLVHLALFVIVAAVATFSYGHTKRQMAAHPMTPATGPDGRPVPGMDAITGLMPLMSFMTLFTVAFVPLAAALYVVTSTTWTAIERACLYRDLTAPGTPVTAAV
ncbi:YidC/Oxa1 family membrane protein insertase [Streptomyces fulvorobeus]|uniref:Membrane protein insertase YidC n=1 Tax=Streptomyces fulvorobeus TaxID=284028 RepID=A0A7J0C5C2_9ACTN|nr:YidC/Oxa1 family membrane protein insertase [Streptomyces fulvorobeus]NYE41020.1 YidC/Oxa1 family membrane protein insertase [Streptomyces fulvorobeus]GFM97347.1 membrane protein [Streptomyces fulvorobeus]